MAENQEFTQELISSLNQSKEKMLECISKDSLDEKFKKKMLNHIFKIDEILINELSDKDIYHRIIEVEEKV